ncbi:MAG: peptidase U32 family protein, partial [Halobacteriota archaeon]|nr:peptidase U32 family protein [Halobacteriota archaeon]
MKKVELLAPAKNIKSIKAGLSYADAFYFGSKRLNMRMQADNFSDDDLSRAVEICHNEGKKAYFVSNILIYENELKELERSLEYAKSLDFDAAIVNDLSAIEICREVGIPFHISTQQNISNSRAARFFEDIGARRIIMARECSLEQIKEIKRSLTKTEIEAFVHGAMCTMVSGRCYFSMD